MSIPEDIKKELFPINRLATTCNISRSTIMRFEDEGLFCPAYKDPETGYRYYSIRNLAEIVDILKYQELGFTKKEIKAIRNNPKMIDPYLKALKKKHDFILREIEDMSATIEDPSSIIVRTMETRGGYFFTRVRKMIYTPENVRGFARETFREFIKMKTPGITDQTMKIYIDDADFIDSFGQFDRKEHVCRAIIPTRHKGAGSDFIYIDPCIALTLSCKCNYANSDPLFYMIVDEAQKRDLQNEGPVCIAGLPEIFFSDDTESSNTTLRLMMRTTLRLSESI